MKKNFSVIFLILHFMDQNLTYRAVDSLHKLDYITECRIIIVDNGSPNRSGAIVKSYFKNDPLVDTILLSNNEGFSSGNNAGFKYIKENYNCKFLIVMNNDILFYQKNFINCLFDLYKEYPFYVAGPDIYVPQRCWHSSPLRKELMSKQEFIIYVNEWKNKISKMQVNFKISTYKAYLLDRTRDTKFYKAMYNINRKIRGQSNLWYKDKLDNCVLQGACIIFDKRYCELFDELFYPETFLYSEEDILTYRCLKHNLQLWYFPEIQVYHTCQGSTHKQKESYKSYRMKKIIEFERELNALKVFANLQGFTDIKI